MKFFGLFLLQIFLRLQIYKAMAAIFWQSVSYVFSLQKCRHLNLVSYGWHRCSRKGVFSVTLFFAHTHTDRSYKLCKRTCSVKSGFEEIHSRCC